MTDPIVQQAFDLLTSMTVLQTVELNKKFETELGISAAAPMAMAAMPAAGGTAAAAEEKTEFDVTLANVGANKIEVIKVVRTITGLGLKEAKELVEKAPSLVKEGVTKDDAQNIKKQLEAAGATVEVK